jgi:hypothetical protein
MDGFWATVALRRRSGKAQTVGKVRPSAHHPTDCAGHVRDASLTKLLHSFAGVIVISPPLLLAMCSSEFRTRRGGL